MTNDIQRIMQSNEEVMCENLRRSKISHHELLNELEPLPGDPDNALNEFIDAYNQTTVIPYNDCIRRLNEDRARSAPFYACILRVDVNGETKYAIKCERDTTISAWDTEVQATEYWSRGFRRAMGMGGGFAAGAVITSGQLNPSIVQVSENILRQQLFTLTDDGKLAEVVTVRAHGEIGMIIHNQEAASELWSAGSRPSFF